ncbi:quaternary ammonium compound-resistance protein SugE [Paramicrobacterium humi]|uniref:Quaternary ammonium compound-resistance protein SugE n=1 Tax=Paramicrobacterium humi TaxID=640635 RepID=A0A1H4LF73_9MICO|nr:multidrug efflux SMR transporter [Microbacterium humi]SEB69367.1 quaternary ammonium compound-resistance protein SugE [Microbacterium humi]
MHWIVLIVSAGFEAVWATALGASHGLSEPAPTVVFALGLTASMVGLGVAMKRIPVSVAYAVWTGLGAALTVSYAMLSGLEPVSVLKVLFLAGIVGCVIGLKFAAPAPGERAEPDTQPGETAP